jgi:uncharacterized protein YdaU (DUF1376 family)
VVAVNYYQHHIGDYSKDTAHLSMLEDAAYRRMLDVVYATEKPLPKDQLSIYRLVRARSHAEKLAVDVVLGEFWIEGEHGWHNKRVEEELAKARTKSEKARDSASARWNANASPAHSERNANASNSHSDGNAPNNQEPRTNKRGEATRGTRLPPDWRPSELLSAWAGKERPDLDVDAVAAKFRDHWAAKPGKAGLKLDWDATFRNWVRDEKPGRQPHQQRIQVDL